MSYLGSKFGGWQHGNSNANPAVQCSLAAAIAATGVCDKGQLQLSSRQARRAAVRELRKAHAIQLAAAVTAAASSANVEANPDSSQLASSGSSDAQAAPSSKAVPVAVAVAEGGVGTTGQSANPAAAAASTQCSSGWQQLSKQQQQPPVQEARPPLVQCGGRTDAGVTAVGQVRDMEWSLA